MSRTIAPAAGLLAAALLAAGCGPARTGRVPQPPVPIPALAATDGAGAAISLPVPGYPVPARVEYRVQGTLPALPGTASAHRLGQDTTGDGVTRLASALGVRGTVHADASGWTVTGGASSLHVERTAGLPWQLFQAGGSGVGISGCAVAVPGRPADAEGSKPAAPPVVQAPPPCAAPTPVPGLPSRADAEARARSVLGAAGLDLSGAAVQASGGIGEWFVGVTPAVGGVPLSGAGWSVVIGPRGALLSGSGWLATPSSAGEYPLVGVDTGIARLKEGGRWIVRGGPGPVPLMGASAGGGHAASTASSIAPAPPAAVPPVAPAPPGSKAPPPARTPGPIPVTVITVTGVHLGLACGTPAAGGGEAWLVPVYVFELAGGGTIPVLAVADGLLATPAPVPTGPGTTILPLPAPAVPQGTATSPNG